MWCLPKTAEIQRTNPRCKPQVPFPKLPAPRAPVASDFRNALRHAHPRLNDSQRSRPVGLTLPKENTMLVLESGRGRSDEEASNRHSLLPRTFPSPSSVLPRSLSRLIPRRARLRLPLRPRVRRVHALGSSLHSSCPYCCLWLRH